MQPVIDHIVLDVGRVLVRWDPELGYLDLIPDESERAWFLDNVCNHDWIAAQDRGRRWSDAEDLLASRYPDHEANIRAFRRNWHKMVPGEMSETVEILRALVDEGRDVTLLTNFAADTFAEACRRFDFLNLTRGATVSGLVGYIKPEREIYDLHSQTFDLKPSATLFVDDNANNVKAAKAAGWNSVQFLDEVKLKRDLKKFGIAI